jgi:hypothetical protein
MKDYLIIIGASVAILGLCTIAATQASGGTVGTVIAFACGLAIPGVLYLSRVRGTR